MNGALRTSLMRLGGHGHSGPAKRVFKMRVNRIPALQTVEEAHALRVIYSDNYFGQVATFAVPMLIMTCFPAIVTDFNHYKAYKDSL